MQVKNERIARWLKSGKLHLLLCTVALLTLSNLAMAAEIHGVVSYHGVPVPGATVTVTVDGKSVDGKAEVGKKFVTVTDVLGRYSFAEVPDGAAAIQVEMTGFTPIKQSLTVAPDQPAGKWELTQMSLDEMRAALKPVLSEPFTVAQVRSEPLQTAEAPKPEAGKDAKGKAAAKESASAAAPADDVAQGANDGLLINGSVNNASTSQYSLAPRFGNTASGRSMYSYAINLRLDTSALDAKAYSLTGLDTTKPNTDQLTGGFSVQGPIKIPHLLKKGPNLFLSYQRVQNSSATTQNGIMPIKPVANADYAISQTIYAPTIAIAPTAAACLSAAGDAPGSIITSIPAACISTAAQALLNLYPSPNVPTTVQGNYQVPVVSDTHSDSLNSSVWKSFGPRNRENINGNFALTSTRSSNGSLLGFVDASSGLGISSGVGWSHTFTPRLHLNLNYSFSRQSSRSRPYWQNRANISQQAGITGNDQDPAYWGPPALGFSSGIAGLSDGNSSFNRNETNSVSSSMNWNHGQHNVALGGDFRRLEFNYLSQANPRGSFNFNGTATSGNVTGAGSDFADFLLGIPDTSSISYGNADKYLRQSTYDAYVRDDWRASPQVTVNAGLRWEYGAPVTEVKARLANVDVASGFTADSSVLAGNPVGTSSGQRFPSSLLRSDRAGLQPRIGVSWRPIPGSSLVIGAGYGMNFDTSVYPSIALQMAQQAELQSPSSKVLLLTNGAGCSLTLANGFPTPGGSTATQCSSSSTLGTFGVDPNLRVGYVQSWNLQLRRDLPGSLQMVAIYLGNKGTRGAQLFLPNTLAPGSTSAANGPSGYEYLMSNGNSHRESGQFQLRRRLHNGFTASATYTYSKSMDDVSSLGGQGAAIGGSVAQDWSNLSGERGLSNFDQRHLLNTSLQYTTGMGLRGGTLMGGWRGRLYKDWTVQTQINTGSGTPETPVDSAVTVVGYSASVRPDVTGAPLYSAPAGLHLNPAAYKPPNSGYWGDARRNSITGPNKFSMSATMSRSFRMKDKYSLDLTLAAANVLNHVVYSRWQSSITNTQFGLPTSANSMRDINASLRMRF